MSSRWIAIAKQLLDDQHDLHPRQTGTPACEAFAWIDLIGLAAWEDGDEHERGQVVGFSERDLAKRWNWSRSKVTRFLARLEREARIYRPNHQPNHQPNQLTIVKYDRYQKPRTTNRTTNRTTHSIYIQDNTKETSNKPPEPDVLDLWEHYQALRRKWLPGDVRNMKLTPKRRKRIERRLHEYSVASLRHALDGMFASDFHVTNGYTDIELCFRSPEKVDQFLDIADRAERDAPSAVPPGRAFLDAIDRAGTT